MPRTLTLADGQLGTTAGAILPGTLLPSSGDRITLVMSNAGDTTEEVVVSFQLAGGTARQLYSVTLGPGETNILDGWGMHYNDTLLAVTTTAATVDYIVSGHAEGKLEIYTLSSSGRQATAPDVEGQFDSVMDDITL